MALSMASSPTKKDAAAEAGKSYKRMSAIDWEAQYRDGETPWEKGEPHPALPLFLRSHAALFEKNPRVFHPGCGYGRDAALLAEQAESVTALDIAETPIAEAKKLHSHQNIRWAIGDLFTWPEIEKYNLVWEHTCISALPPSVRPDYARAIHQVLKPSGILCGVFFLTPDHDPEEGPPFQIRREQLHEMFDFGFDLIEDLPDPVTYKDRENRETIMVWKKR